MAMKKGPYDGATGIALETFGTVAVYTCKQRALSEWRELQISVALVFTCRNSGRRSQISGPGKHRHTRKELNSLSSRQLVSTLLRFGEAKAAASSSDPMMDLVSAVWSEKLASHEVKSPHHQAFLPPCVIDNRQHLK